MISVKHRFHGYGSLKFVYRNGHTIHGPLFSIKSSRNPRRQTYRLAIVVSRKVNKSAVARNRIRRRLYEIVRNMEKDIVEPHDVVLTVFHDSVMDEDYKKLASQVRKQLKEAGVVVKRVT
jgi:ribonuclease P protein component